LRAFAVKPDIRRPERLDDLAQRKKPLIRPLFPAACQRLEATMRTMPAPLEIYEQMCMLSARMVEAARANDWDRLIALERAVAELRDALLQAREGEAESPQAAARRRELIRRILEDDAEVRRHTEPWMEKVRRFLTGSRRPPGERAARTGR
jgi:flagellar protein FliT